MEQKYKIGDRVRFISERWHQADPQFYPEPGTIGTVIGIDTFGNPDVQWPRGSTSGKDRWRARSIWVEHAESEVKA